MKAKILMAHESHYAARDPSSSQKRIALISSYFLFQNLLVWIEEHTPPSTEEARGTGKASVPSGTGCEPQCDLRQASQFILASVL